MPERGLKRRISESTCDSSSCVFCIQRFPHPPDPVEEDTPTEEGQASSNDSKAASDFHSWLQKQTSDKALLAGTDLGKMGLPTHQLDAYLPTKQGHKLEAKHQHCESVMASSCPFLSSQPVLPDSPQTLQQDREVPWSWSDSWQDQPDPVPACFRDVASFQQPVNSSNMRQHTADILCGVEFSPDARFLATAGVAKQVSQFLHSSTAVFCMHASLGKHVHICAATLQVCPVNLYNVRVACTLSHICFTCLKKCCPACPCICQHCLAQCMRCDERSVTLL